MAITYTVATTVVKYMVCAALVLVTVLALTPAPVVVENLIGRTREIAGALTSTRIRVESLRRSTLLHSGTLAPTGLSVKGRVLGARVLFPTDAATRFVLKVVSGWTGFGLAIASTCMGIEFTCRFAWTFALTCVVVENLWLAASRSRVGTFTCALIFIELMSSGASVSPGTDTSAKFTVENLSMGTACWSIRADALTRVGIKFLA